MLPSGLLFGRINLKGLNKKWSGWGTKEDILKKNCFHLHIFSNFREAQEIFPLTQTNSVFLKPKFLQKVKIPGGPDFFPKRPSFSPGLAKKFCKELATLELSL